MEENENERVKETKIESEEPKKTKLSGLVIPRTSLRRNILHSTSHQ